MKVAEFLKKVGAKAGFIRMVEEIRNTELPALQTKNLSLIELQQQFENSRQENIITVAPELTLSFDTVFEAVKLPVFEHGWNVIKVKELLSSEEFKKLEAEAVKKALVEALKTLKIPQEDILKDALSRDQAMDIYEEFVAGKVDKRSTLRQEEIEKLEQQISDCRQKITEIRSTQLKEEDHLKDWMQRKTKEEEELVSLVSMITSQHGITVGKQAKKDK